MNKIVKKKILVVDDEISICMLLQNFLSQEYEVITIYSALEALDWLEGNLPEASCGCNFQPRPPNS